MNDVYFLRAKKFEPLEKLLKRLSYLFSKSNILMNVEPEDFIAVKIHCGEDTNTTSIRPEIIFQLANDLKLKTERVFITDTNVLYQSSRKNAIEHLMLMESRGISTHKARVPVIIADGLLGSNSVKVPIDKKHFKTVDIATDIAMSHGMLVVSHPTGHLSAGYGGAIKNVGMGCASRKGKLQMHSKMKPKINKNKCTACMQCITWCPMSAISLVEKKAVIDQEKCIGCGQCLAVCRFDAVKFDWRIDPGEFQEKIVEYAYGAVKSKTEKTAYTNVLLNITKDCDCIRKSQIPLMEDIGILASDDPVAIDTASLYLIKEINKKRLRDMAYDIDYTVQLRYAQELGMGSIDFNLIEIE